MIQISQEALGVSLICSVRYALGRKSYMPGMIMEIVKNHARFISEGDREVIVQSIREAARFDRGLGRAIDYEEEWLELADWLERLR